MRVGQAQPYGQFKIFSELRAPELKTGAPREPGSGIPAGIVREQKTVLVAFLRRLLVKTRAEMDCSLQCVSRTGLKPIMGAFCGELWPQDRRPSGRILPDFGRFWSHGGPPTAPAAPKKGAVVKSLPSATSLGPIESSEGGGRSSASIWGGPHKQHRGVYYCHSIWQSLKSD